MSGHTRPGDFGKVAVLMGGTSAEREISLMSGNAVLDALRRQGVDAEGFDPASRSLCELKPAGFSRAFIALHGRGGEDGSVQGALETLGVLYTGSGVMASALCLDKWRTKLVWQATGIPTPKSLLLRSPADLQVATESLACPFIVKPVHEGSTIGLTKVANAAELPPAYKVACRHDSLVLAEEFIAGQELTVGILGDEALPVIRIEAPQGNYDYQNKYFSDETRYHCPAGLDAAMETAIREAALAAFRVLGCHGWGRADLILPQDGRFQFLEMNTVPGMTGHSLVPMAAKVAGRDFDALVLAILRTSDAATRTTT
jgi:D-alanine-D-alanine ligase